MGIEIKMSGNWASRSGRGARHRRRLPEDVRLAGPSVQGAPRQRGQGRAPARVVSARWESLRCRTDRLRPTHQCGHPHRDAGRQVAERLERGARGRVARPRSTNAAELPRVRTGRGWTPGAVSRGCRARRRRPPPTAHHASDRSPMPAAIKAVPSACGSTAPT